MSWWHKSFLLDELSEVEDGAHTVNSMTLPNLSRQHLRRELTCHVSNSNLTSPVLAPVVLDMQCEAWLRQRVSHPALK